ncbi:t-SNARE [Jimgerdemannia flammicorona]|uniref:t-SNARE n=2 Tax=Jimgerdemannia flammicorona TaxID=994334 RepID=A0A433QAP0_9FUNG|nr:t-SNARE [Jimgerdemannia flammicorona]RUS26835.1 t-SNARE [Jimgerdemannia flammicorona]
MSFSDLERGLGSSSGPARAPPRPFTGITQQGYDDDREYNLLSRRISQEVFNITSNVGSIQKLVTYLGTNKDTPDPQTHRSHARSGKGHDRQYQDADPLRDRKSPEGREYHASSFVFQAFRRRLGKPSFRFLMIPNLRLNDATQRQRKIEQQKLSKDFQKVIADFARVQRLSAEKQREYVDKAKANVRNDMYEEDEPSEEQPLIDDSQRRLQLQVLDSEVEYNETLIAEREVEIREIEQGITELNEIFRDLGTLVNEQESGLMSIVDNVSNIVTNVRAGADELTKASHHQRSARNRMCCLLLIFVVITGVVALVIVAAR